MRIYIDEYCLLLEDAQFDSEGHCIAGLVVNGLWYFRWTATLWFAYSDENSDLLSPVTHWPFDKRPSFVIVPEDVHGDYNAVIEWARKQEVFTGTPAELSDFQDMAEIERINRKAPSGYEDFDDDIPF